MVNSGSVLHINGLVAHEINHCFAKPGFLCRTGPEPALSKILAQSSKASRHAVLALPYV